MDNATFVKICTAVGIVLIGSAIIIHYVQKKRALLKAADALKNKAKDNKRVGILSDSVAVEREQQKKEMDKTVLLLLSSTV